MCAHKWSSTKEYVQIPFVQLHTQHCQGIPYILH